MFDCILRNVHIIQNNQFIDADIGIIGDTIHEISEHIEMPCIEEIPCAGLLAIPGCVDPHVHLRTPGNTEKEDMTTGTKAAIKGGYTTVLDMPNTKPSVTSEAILQEKKQIAQDTAYSNIGFFLGASPENASKIGNISGACAIKMYMGASTGSLLVERFDMQEAVFQNSGEYLVCVHAEDEAMMKEAQNLYAEFTEPEIHSCIRYNGCAEAATKTAIELAKKHHKKVHICHMSTAGEVELVRNAKKQGVNVTCEVAPHHLYLSIEDYMKKGNYVKMNPPVRSQQDIDALWEGISDGTVDMIASDHAPHLKSEKEQSYWDAPSGVPELDTNLQLMLLAVEEKKITWDDLVRLTSTAAVERFQLGKRGKIEVGYIADIALLDIYMPWKISVHDLETKCAWTPYEGWEGRGKNKLTLIAGEVVYEDPLFHKSEKKKVF